MKLLENYFLSKVDINEFYYLRDSDSFDTEWLNTYNELKNIKIDDESQTLIDSIREISYKYVFKVTQDSEIASYIYDDFELISKSIYLKKENWAIVHSWEAYKNGRIFLV